MGKMKKINVAKTVFIIVFLIASKSLFATDYYVSSSQGNDSNNGTSPSTPWKTLLKIRQTIFFPGDVIHFKRGDVWKEDRELFIAVQGTPSNPIVFTDYGSGDLPEINVLETMPNNLPWVDEGNNIWSIVLDNSLVNNSDIPYWTVYHKLKRLLINGQEVLGAAVGHSSELGSFVPDQVRFYYEEGNSRLLKIYSAVNPNSLTLELSYRQYVIHVEKYSAPADDIPHDVIIENLKTTGGDVAAVKITEGTNIVIRNIDAGEYANYGITITKACSSTVIDSCYIDSRYDFDYSEAGISAGTSNRGPREGLYLRGADVVECKNNIVKNFTHANINIGKDWSGDLAENDIIHDNYTTTNLAYGGRTVVEAGTHSLEYYNNFIDGAAVSNQFSGQNGHYHHNIIRNVISTPLKHYHAGWGVSLYPYSNFENTSGNIFENNLIMDCESGGISITNASVSEVTNNIFRNNILINNGKIVTHFTAYPQNQSSNNNLAIKISDPYDWSAHQFVAPFVSGNTFQNNLVFVTEGEARFLYHLDDNDPNGWTTPSINITQFNDNTGQNLDAITDNIESDPVFVDLANGDYHLQSTSPAIDAGATPLATEDYDGNPIPSDAADIGVYEYQPALAVEYLSPLRATVVGKKVLLNWICSKEENNDYFLVERSQNVVDWEVIGRIDGDGMSRVPKNYKLFDSEAPSGILYYRLKQVDFGGSYSYSNTVSVFLRNVDFQVYPNPSNGFMKILNPGNHKIQNISLISLNGQKVLTNVPLNEMIDLTFLGTGLYFLRFETANEIIIKKVVLLD